MRKFLFGIAAFVFTFGVFIFYNLWSSGKKYEEAAALTEKDFVIIETEFTKVKRIEIGYLWIKTELFYLIYTRYSDIPFRTPNTGILTPEIHLGNIEDIPPGSKLTLTLKRKELASKGRGNLLESVLGKEKNNSMFLYDLSVNGEKYFTSDRRYPVYGESKISSNTYNWIVVIICVLIVAYIGFKYKFII